MDYVWGLFGPEISSFMFTIATIQSLIPNQLKSIVDRLWHKLLSYFCNAYIHITFDEYSSGCNGRSKAYAAIETYLTSNISAHAESLKAYMPDGTRRVALSMDDDEEVFDFYNGVRVSWVRTTTYPKSNIISYGARQEVRRAYIMSLRKEHRDVIIGSYLSHVVSEGRAMAKRNRRQRLYTNVCSGDSFSWGDDVEDKLMWRHVSFEHPATFDTLAMDPDRKKDIVDDLIEFTQSREYYRKIGKPWKRGYLLYGPPGTGKSTMIAAMANFLHYDVYDLELTAIKNNTHLRKLMIEISKRAIVVIEDIDCSLHITRKRKNNADEKDESDDEEDEEDEKDLKKSSDDDEDDEKSKVTLSGLLNFMDGLWSASGGERVFVFTTNYVEKLDPALIRRGRMDKHIEMSYCGFEAFKALANNYLKVGPSHDEKFDEIRELLEGNIKVSPADVADQLMPKSPDMSTDECLDNLIAALKKVKDESEKSDAKKLDAKIARDINKKGEKRRSKVLRRLKSRLAF
ncbi:probable mitochondrial chaperone bcs1-b [Phtheirospermum japonicum]|uniref:Probable mitochondrial chaperone bcs1-b n=1 Tax=Phtheirospermum japonicum TaxID=374723 RepID=A0A830BNH6_9LAMI|nr:probable mitochondrial chaperone bcs1-b [Phtheirospermum japonicum]